MLHVAVNVPDDIVQACSKVFFGRAGDVVSQETGEVVEMFSAVGTVPMHRDTYFDSDENDFATMGLVLVNECDACLTDGEAILPLPVGSVFRHNPSRMHGTCLADGSHTPDGAFVFLTCDFDNQVDPEDDPRDFAGWAIDQVREKLQELGLLGQTTAANMNA